jgi:NAD(P)-dependent dehydrogenase (short-subunit alcohol dehydrogenase family)
MRLKDKVALITGATSGIGQATAILFAREGAKVVIVGRNQKRGNETVKIIKRDGGEAMFVRADVSKAVEVEKMVRAAIEKYGRLDILFNNAGIVLVHKIVDTTEEEWDRVIDTNLKSVFLGSRCAIPEMMKQGGGIIINTSSVFGLIGAPRYAAYCTSKGGIILLTKAMALECAPHKIRVNCICPGSIYTSMQERELAIFSNLHERSEKQVLQSKIQKIPIGRIGKPEDIANAALYLASEQASFVTGATLVVDGGFSAKGL